MQYKTKMLYRCKLHYILEVDTLVYEKMCIRDRFTDNRIGDQCMGGEHTGE